MTTLNLFVGGQSFAEIILSADGKPAFVAACAKMGVSPVNMVGYARSGSSMLKANAPAGQPTWHWWDETTNSAGPLLTAAVSYIGTLSSPKPNRILWMQGEADTFDPLINPATFISATTSVLAALKTALGGSVGVVLQPVGRRIAAAPVPGVQIIREAQLDLIAAGVAAQGGDPYALPLLGDDPWWPLDSHPSIPARGNLAWSMAQRLIMSVGLASRQAPLLSGAITRNGNDIMVPMATFVGVGNLIKPASPSHLAIRDASGVIESPSLTFSWSGDTLTITPPRAFGTGHFLAPYGDLSTIDRDNLIREDLYGLPLRSTKAVIPA